MHTPFKVIASVIIGAQIFLFSPLNALAQVPSSSPLVSPENNPAIAQSIAGFTDARFACMDNYNFGSVVVSIDSAKSVLDHQYLPGETITVAGTLHNPNNYPLVEGRMYAHILREEATMADKNWHPYLSQEFVPGEYNLDAGQTKDFTYSYRIPAESPAGVYRVELYYLVGNRYVMSGIPYVANFTGASAPFTVLRPTVTSTTGSSDVSGFDFDRNSVTINDKKIQLREIPPQFDPGKKLVITANLGSLGKASVTGTVQMDLYKWSITDGSTPILTESFPVTVGAKDVPVTFTWDSATPGTYEAVFRASNTDVESVPSILNIRFPVTGLVPRIVYSGIGAIADGKATINACVVNATFGEGTGTMTNELSIEKNISQTKDASVSADQLSTALITSSLADLAGKAFDVHVVAKDASGSITDETTVSYPAGTIAGAQTSLAPVDPVQVAGQQKSYMLWYVLGAIALLLVFIGTVLFVRRSRKSKFPVIS